MSNLSQLANGVSPANGIGDSVNGAWISSSITWVAVVILGCVGIMVMVYANKSKISKNLLVFVNVLIGAMMIGGAAAILVFAGGLADTLL